MHIISNGINVPNFLDINFFKKVLNANLECTDYRIESVKFEMGSSAGDNFTSIIYRVHIDYTKNNSEIKTIPVIIKTMNTSGSLAILDDLNTYVKEKFYCSKVLSAYESYIQNIKFGPRSYYGIPKPLQTIVFEDLCALGYRNGNRCEGFNENYAKFVLTKLGKLHACSMLLCEQNPKVMDYFKIGFFSPTSLSRPIYKSLFNGCLEHLIIVIENWPGYELIAQKLQKVHSNYTKRLLDIVALSSGEIRVLNHGDLWVNNIILKYDKDDLHKLEDVIFLDYQISIYGSLGIDINYFLNTSVQLNVLKSKREVLIQNYYNSFSTTLKQLSYSKIPTYEAVRNEIHKKEFYGFVACSSILPLISAKNTEHLDYNFDAIIDERKFEKIKANIFSSERFVETMKYSLLRFDQLKIFD